MNIVTEILPEPKIKKQLVKKNKSKKILNEKRNIWMVFTMIHF